MRLGLGKFYKFSLIVLTPLLSSGDLSAQDTITYEQEIKLIEQWNLDSNLLPAQEIYGMSWSGEHVDSPAYNYERMTWGYLIDLREEGCEYVHPFKGAVTSKYGWRRSRWHKGIDIDLEIGDPVYAAFDGIVRIQRYNPGGYGNYVMIRHYNGLETIYGHLSQALVTRNQTVRAGQIIGFGGSTGRSTGSHLHFETRLMGQAFDPARIIDFNTYSLKMDQAWITEKWFPYIKDGNPKSIQVPKTVKRYHKIRKGDTLIKIARRYGTTVTAICRLNGISRKTTLRIGRTLRVK